METWQSLAGAYFGASVVLIMVAAGVATYERFTQASRRFFVVVALTSGWLATLGMAVLAMGPGELFWLRATWVIDPFTAPALFWLVQALTGVRHRAMQIGMWGAAGLFAATSFQGPWLVEGLESATRGLTFTDWGWLGALYFLYVSGVVGMCVRELATSTRQSITPADVLERGAVLVGAIVGAMTLVDYWLPTAVYRAGPLTPPVMIFAALVGGWVAVRYRVFSVSRSFGTDEVLEAMSDAVLMVDESGRIRGTNRGARELFGRPEAELLGRNVEEFVREAGGRVGWMPEQGAVVRDAELLVRSATGALTDVSVAAEPLTSRGRQLGTVVVARDVRDRLTVERALEAAELRYKSLYWHNPGLTYEVDVEGRIVSINDAAAKVLGRPAEEVLGLPFAELLDPEGEAVASAVFEAAYRGEPWEYELTLRGATDPPVILKGVSIPIMEDGELVAVSGVAFDVTGERRAQRDAETQRRYFADLFENLPEAIVLVDSEDRVLRVNDEFTRLFGYTDEEVLGRVMEELVVPPERCEEARVLAERALAGEPIMEETVRRRKDGSEVDVSVLGRTLNIPGEPLQIYAIYRDISDRKEAERQLRAREEELRHAQKMEAVGTLAGGIAHDFNNLMTVINGHVRFALDDLSDPDRARLDLQEIERAGDRAAKLTQQLLAFSSRQVLRPHVLDVNEVMVEMERMLGRLIGEQIRLETRLCSRDCRVRADRGQVEQVVVNLAVNARDAMPDGGVLTITTEAVTLDTADMAALGWDAEAGHYVRLTVADTGVGMAEETLDHIFDPFFSTKERGKGTGLGLSTVFGIAKQSGGHIVAESSPGAGSRFVLYLPVGEPEPSGSAGHAVSAPEPAPEPSPEPAPSCTVLVVEDEDGVRALVARVMERAGHTVMTAGNGKEALAALDASNAPPDLVLTDMVMPEMGGLKLAEALRGRWPGLPILFMSGYDDVLIDDAGEAPDFLSKPFSPAELARRVAEILARRP